MGGSLPHASPSPVLIFFFICLVWLKFLLQLQHATVSIPDPDPEPFAAGIGSSLREHARLPSWPTEISGSQSARYNN